MNIMDLVSALKMDVSDFLRGKDVAKSGMAELKNAAAETSQALGQTANFGDQVTNFGKAARDAGAMLSVGLTAPIAAAGAAILKFGGDFEASMTRVQVLGEVSTDNLKKLTDQAIDLGIKTPFSAKQAADAMGEFAAQGFKANEIMAAMPGILGLAAAGQVSTATAAKYTSDILHGFQLEATEAGRVADILAKASADSGTTVESLGNSFRYVGPIASAAGLSLSQVAASLEILGDAGVRGSKGGTAMVQFIKDLINPSKDAAAQIEEWGLKTKDAAGNLLPLSELLNQLNTIQGEAASKTKFLSEAFAIWGVRTSDIIPLITAGGDKVTALSEKLDASKGAAVAMGEALMKNFKGSLEQLKGSLETLGIALFNAFGTTMKGFTDNVTGFVNQLIEMAKAFGQQPDYIKNTVLALAAVLAGIGPILLIVGQLISAWGTLGTLFTASVPLITAASGAVVGMVTTLGSFILVTKEAGVVQAFSATFPVLSAAVSGAGAAITAFTGNLGAFITLAKEYGVVQAFSAAFPAFTSGATAATGATTALATGLKALGAAAVIAAGAFAAIEIGKAVYNWKTAADGLDQATGLLTRSTTALEAQARALGLTVSQGNKSLEEYNLELNKAIRATPDYQEKLRALADQGKRTADVKKDLATATEQSSAKMAAASTAAAEHSAKLAAVESATKRFSEALQASREHVDTVAESADKLQRSLGNLHSEIEPIPPAIDAIAESLQSVADLSQVEEWAQSLDEALSEIEPTLEPIPDVIKVIGDTMEEEMDRGAVSTERSLGRQKNAWSDYARSVQSALSNLGKDIGGGLWDLITGKTNDKLDQQAAELRANLAERTAAWEQYQSDVAAKIEELTRANAEDLAKEVAALQANLDERRQQWEQYQADAAAKLQDFKAAQDEKLAEELAQLQANLQDRQAAWEKYQADTMAKFADFKAAQDEKLAEELAQLQANLDERGAAWVDYQADVAAKFADFKAAQDADLAKDLAALQRSLDDKREAWEKYRSDQLTHLDDFRAAQDEQLAKERESLAKSLDDKRQDYEEYVADVNTKLASLREDNAEGLAKDLAALAKSLDEKRKAYDKYVSDINQKMRRIGDDLAESIDDETRDTQRGIDDKRRAYARDEQDINDKIARELAKGKDANKQNIADWYESLRRKKEDLEIYVSRAQADLAEFTDDHKRQADQQTADLKQALADRQQMMRDDADANAQKVGEVTAAAAAELSKQENSLFASLKKRTADWQAFQRDIAAKQADAQGDHDRAIAAEEKKVHDSLAARDADWAAYQAEIARKVGEAQTTHDQKIDAEARKVADSLASRKEEWEKYQAEIARKIAAAQKTHDDAIAAEQRKVAASLADRLADWQKYQEDIAAKIAAAQKTHDDAIAAEEKKVADSLAARKAEWDKYQADIAHKLEETTAKHAEELDKELADLKKAFADKLAEYDKHRTDIQNKLKDLEDDHLTFWGVIVNSATTALGKIAEATLALPFQRVFGELVNIIRDDVLPHLGKVGEILGQIFNTSTGGSSGGGGGGGGIPGVGGGGVGGVGGAAGVATGGIAGLVTAIASVGTLISSIIGNFQQAKMETTLNAIEESTRYLKIDFHGTFMDRVNQYYPKLDQDQFHYGVLIPALNEISDETRDKGSAVRDRVIDLWNTTIQAKDILADGVGKIGNMAGDIITVNSWLSRIFDVLDGVRTATQSTANDIAEFDTSGITRSITAMSTAVTNSLGTVQGAISGLGSNFNTSLQNEVRLLNSSLTTIAGNISNADPRNIINTGFANLQNALSFLSQIPQSISSAASSQPRTTQTNQYITINGFAVNQSLATILRTYGVPI